MRTILSALCGAFSYGWWSYTIFCGGKTHDSYDYAVWKRWQARQRLNLFLSGMA